ncbi:DUF6907 domain-containing protein [Streptomyces sp. NPDC051561]|uniref:DUF6907 domain-containing protein n=1 Tax=Streptomyces sp. NPDC051561 TaxID=3365658 RepID=UPI0037AB14B6
MSAVRTVTVHTVDHGPVTIPEPSWCRGKHASEAYREDIEHQGDEFRAWVPTACHGDVTALAMALVQRPFSPSERRTMAAVYVDGEWHEFDGSGLRFVAESVWRFAMDVMPQLAALVDKSNGVIR